MLQYLTDIFRDMVYVRTTIIKSSSNNPNLPYSTPTLKPLAVSAKFWPYCSRYDPSSDFAEQYPDAQVIGTDLSPMQPMWVPPNVRFELEDCTQPWSWGESSFDFVHLRYLFGAIPDWNGFIQEAYRVTRPGGWVQSCETEVIIQCDDGSIPPDSTFKTFWNKMYHEIGGKIGTSFKPLTHNFQESAFRAAGFRDVEVYDYKVSHKH